MNCILVGKFAPDKNKQYQLTVKQLSEIVMGQVN